MKSNVCKIENGSQDLEAILQESEKIAIYNGLNNHQMLQLRLLCEEMDGMLPKIIDDFNGDFWIEYEDGVCKLNASIELKDFSVKKKKELIAVASNRKNAAVKGIVGKIRSAIEDFFLDEGDCEPYDVNSRYYYIPTDDCYAVDYYHLWGLEQYRSTITYEEKKEEWDELEKSIIASIADDVIVGVKGKKVNILIIKKFL
jgi:hypothetical protein